MANKIFGRFVRTALAVAALSACQFASAVVVAGDYVKINSSPVGNLGGGAFLTKEVSSTGSALSGEQSFYTFCLEFKESFSPSSSTFSGGDTLKVAGVTNHTTNATNSYYTSDAIAHPETGHTATQDPLSLSTEWLFTRFNTNSAFKTQILTSDSTANSFQRAIWYLEGELVNSTYVANYNSDVLATQLVAMANTNSVGWSDTGNQVRVLNLMKKDSYGNYTVNSQDQLYFVSAVPETETYAMMLAGLGLMGTIARRRKNKNA
jgi:hypothetical protein